MSHVKTESAPASDIVHADALLAHVDRISTTVAALHAEDVDHAARFPVETIQALGNARLLSAGIPRLYGGGGCRLETLAQMCTSLARSCASSAMIFAMHQIQIASIVEHRAEVPELAEYLRDVVEQQRLIASVTSEVGTGGDLRRSIAAVIPSGEAVAIQKAATTISYCEQADDLLVTLRRASDAAPSDQVLLLLRKGQFSLQETGDWNTLGMRGTCSPAATVIGTGAAWQILPAPFRIIASVTMVPVSHILWAAVWFGIASDAFDRARRMTQIRGRKDADSATNGGINLAALATRLDGMRARLESAIHDHAQANSSATCDSTTDMRAALRMNYLKLAASEDVIRIVSDAIQICGIASYRNGGEFSLGRHLRDAHSAPLMINNDRIRRTNADLLLVYKGR